MIASLHVEMPNLGEHVAIDGSDLPAYANGQRFLLNYSPERQVFSDPDASWGTVRPSAPARAAASTGTRCTRSLTPTRAFLSWGVATALTRRFRSCRACWTSSRATASVPPSPSQTRDTTLVRSTTVRGPRRPPRGPSAGDAVRQGWQGCPAELRARHLDVRRFRRKAGAANYRCPSGECFPAAVWIKADRLHTLIPRESDRWKAIYRTRTGVEREFGAA